MQEINFLNSLTLKKNLCPILPSKSNASLAGYRILGLKPFACRTCMILPIDFQHPEFLMISLLSILIPLQIIPVFSLEAFMIFSLALQFQNFIKLCLGVSLFSSILLGTRQALIISRIDSGSAKFSSFISLFISSAQFSLLSFSGILIKWMFEFLDLASVSLFLSLIICLAFCIVSQIVIQFYLLGCSFSLQVCLFCYSEQLLRLLFPKLVIFYFQVVIFTISNLRLYLSE